MALGSILLSILTVYIDGQVLSGRMLGPFNGWLSYSGSAEGASSVLTTIASSMITIAGVVFSMTLVALTLASSQFGPRLLRNYMGDRSNQFVLGTFVATFLYCLLVLRTIRHDSEEQFVPHLSVTVGVLLAIAGVGVLIHFIHHVSLSIQGDTIVARIGRELNAAIERLVPSDDDDDDDEADGPDDTSSIPDELPEDGYPVESRADGYLQYVDVDSLLHIASEHDALIRMCCQPGQFLSMGSRLAELHCSEEKREELDRGVHNAVSLSYQPSSAQDVEYSMRQLVEVALRALSPGVNEPFTAILCLDRIGSALCRLDDRPLPDHDAHFDEGKLRVLIPATGFADFCSLGLDQIRQNLRGDIRLTLHMLHTINMVREVTAEPGRRQLLLDHARRVLLAARRDMQEKADLDAVEDCHGRLFPDED